jgi:hypothetical protein
LKGRCRNLRHARATLAAEGEPLGIREAARGTQGGQPGSAAPAERHRVRILEGALRAGHAPGPVSSAGEESIAGRPDDGDCPAENKVGGGDRLDPLLVAHAFHDPRITSLDRVGGQGRSGRDICRDLDTVFRGQ